MKSRRLSGAELFAVLVALASLAISVLGNRTQERLLAASVWPYVSFSSCNLSGTSLMTRPVVGQVLRPGDTITYLQLPFTEGMSDGWHKLDRARFAGLVMSVCYCSTLDDCFETRSDRDDPKPVDVCPVPPRSEQWHG